jgi:hypothetical protein
MKQSHLKVTVDMKTLLLQVVTVIQVGFKFIFGQDQNTHEVLVVPILSLEMPVDWGYKRHHM